MYWCQDLEKVKHMVDLRNYKFPTNDKKEWVDDIKSKSKIWSDSSKAMRDDKEKIRLKKATNLPLFGDKDGDKILNVFDRRPFTKDKRSKWGLLR